MLTEYDKENVGSILRGEGDWFTAQLLRLIAKGDFDNRRKLEVGFPDEVLLVNCYLYGKEYAEQWAKQK